MPLDAVCLSAVAAEVRAAAEGGRIDKIFQPGRDEIVLAVRGNGGNHRLLLTANSASPRIQITRINRDNPAQPPKFCMLLRKYLSGARIIAIEQPPMERLVELKLEALNELGDRVQRSLILECMGRRANLILLDEERRIIDCLRKVDGDMSTQRQVMPGLFYRLPPVQAGKQDPLSLQEGELLYMLEQAPQDTRLYDFLLNTFNGLSPLICRELAFQIGGDVDSRLFELREFAEVSAQLEGFFDRIRRESFTPVVLKKEGVPKDFSYLPIMQYGTAMECTEEESFSVMLEHFYAEKETAERVRQIGQGLLKNLTNLRDRTARRVNNQRRELSQAQDRELLRQQGDILTTNLYQMSRGMTSLTVENYYDPDYRPITIRLDPLLTPQQNAAKYYKDYNKAKTAEEKLTDQIEKGVQELEYLESVLQAVRMMESERDLEGIREELVTTGFLTRKGDKRKKPSGNSAKPREFRTSAGLQVLVGRNNLQNDRLTCKQGRSHDLWFHTQKIHGSHVLLVNQGEEPDNQSVTEAAMLAAYYSQARSGENVPVDYTEIRNVKKPNGARPGMVIYNVYHTAYVTPSQDLVEALRVKRG